MIVFSIKNVNGLIRPTHWLKKLYSYDRILYEEKSSEDFRMPFKGKIIGREIIFYEETTSTNEEVLSLGRDKQSPEGLVVIADTQSHGRGRHGRKWISPPGVNLYFTVLLRPPFLPDEVTILPLMASVAVVKAIREYTGLEASIKWPNDIIIRDRKAGGILMEMRTEKGMINLIALGIGVNVNMSLSRVDNDIKLIATSLKEESGRDIDRFGLLKEILTKLDYWYNGLLKGDKSAIIEEWLRLDSTIGHKVMVQMLTPDIEGRRQLSGTAEGIDDRGRLIIRLSSGKIERVCAGDITILKNND